MSNKDPIIAAVNKTYSEQEAQKIIHHWMDFDYRVLTAEERDLESATADILAHQNSNEFPTTLKLIALAFYYWFCSVDELLYFEEVIQKEDDEVEKLQLQQFYREKISREELAWNYLWTAIDTARKEISYE